MSFPFLCTNRSLSGRTTVCSFCSPRAKNRKFNDATFQYPGFSHLCTSAQHTNVTMKFTQARTRDYDLCVLQECHVNTYLTSPSPSSLCDFSDGTILSCRQQPQPSSRLPNPVNNLTPWEQKNTTSYKPDVPETVQPKNIISTPPEQRQH